MVITNLHLMPTFDSIEANIGFRRLPIKPSLWLMLSLGEGLPEAPGTGIETTSTIPLVLLSMVGGNYKLSQY